MIYTGILKEKKMDPLAKRAYLVWQNQRCRCNNKNRACYRYYGEKGIKVEYSSREFIGWWIKEFKKFKKFKGINAQVGRIDHSKNYKFDNIEMISKADNIREKNIRYGETPYGIKRKPVEMYEVKTGKSIIRFKSVLQASKDTGFDCGDVSRYANNKMHCSKRGFSFRFI